MIILIPIGGIGNRFKINGYTDPKSLIKIFGKPIIYYLLDSLNIQKKHIVYIPYNKEYSKYRLEDVLTKNYPNINFKFLCLAQNTRGAAETINIALERLDIDDQPVLCVDGDNFYSVDIIKMWNGENNIIVFEDNNNNPIFSYIKVDEEGNLSNIREKEKISKYACTGSYGFKSYKQLLKYTNIIIKKKILQKGEFYTSSVIKEMIKNDIKFKPNVINIKNFHCLGTPIQLKQFYNNYPKISCINNKQMIKRMRICFDLDNTLVTFPKIKDDYTSVKPIQKNIDLLKYLKGFGHTIIIYTSRRMKTHFGNVGKAIADIGVITFNTLEKFNIVYDEIYFGKPYADVYIDDLGLNCYNDLEKSLGFYMDIVKPRSFNSLKQNSIEVYRKESNDLSGEIYYYNNIPKSVKDLFPIFLDFDTDNKWYDMEKINGLTATSLFVSELLTEDMLKHIMNSIQRIHSIPVEEKKESINIYLNYTEKVKKRYDNYDYSDYKDHHRVYDGIIGELKKYEDSGGGKISVIHGDPVLSNIIINNFGKIKFIDMRGKVGNKLTVYGDRLYDWSKLYQSLIGYDNILQGKNVLESYKCKMIGVFEKYFVENNSEEELNYIKIITKSLLFSLIPLHKNKNKCKRYYELINEIMSDF